MVSIEMLSVWPRLNATLVPVAIVVPPDISPIIAWPYLVVPVVEE